MKYTGVRKTLSQVIKGHYLLPHARPLVFSIIFLVMISPIFILKPSWALMGMNFLTFSSMSDHKVEHIISAQTFDALEVIRRGVIRQNLIMKLPKHLERQAKDSYSFSNASLGFDFKKIHILESKGQLQADELVLKSFPRSLQKKAKKYIRAVLLLSEKHQIDPFWVLSVMWTESHFQPRSKSRVGARGLMQLMPETKTYLLKKLKRRGQKLAIEEPFFSLRHFFPFFLEKNDKKIYTEKLVNIEVGILYLKKLLSSFNYNHKLATVAYNMGPGWTKRQLRRNKPVGHRNHYLRKVKRAYRYMAKRI